MDQVSEDQQLCCTVFHYRQFLLLQQFHLKAEHEGQVLVRLWREELKRTRQLIEKHSSRLVLWYHLRFLVYFWHLLGQPGLMEGKDAIAELLQFAEKQNEPQRASDFARWVRHKYQQVINPPSLIESYTC